MWENANIISAITALLVGGVVTYGVGRLGKGHDARAAAEAALIGIGPTIIAEQNRRIGAMNDDVQRMWGQLRESFAREQECLSRLNALERMLKPPPSE